MGTLVSTELTGHSFNDKWLFRQLSFGIQEGQRVALVGANGAGKSTLLKILAGYLPATEGKIVRAKGLKFGYLEQDPVFDKTTAISDFIFNLDNNQQKLIKEYEELSEQEKPDEEKLNHLINELSELNAWEYEHKIKTILNRLDIHDFNQQISTLSGGQLKRLSLAKLLIEDPDVYVLDEPTNHLDIDTIEWLESFLTSGNKSILMVTHDRYFLDQVCNEIIEIEHGKIFQYKGNYAYFLEKKSERETIEDAVFAKNKNLLKKELEWMRRMPQARATKSKARIDAFYDLEEKTKSRNQKSSVKLEVNISRQGNKVMELKHVSKAFNGKSLINDFSYVFKKGDKIGLTGKNGSGKSTLLNMLTGSLNPDKGIIESGETTVIGYYHQFGLAFDESQRVIDVVKDVAEYIIMADKTTLSASQLLQHFLFEPARQFGLVSKLSGGEKKRLQLMRILMKNPNFLILDEPTNDLDIDTLNVLEEFLENYPGVLMLVSHDRYLVDKLTDQLFILEGDGKVRIFNGNYTDYRLDKDLKEKEQKKQSEQKKQAINNPKPQTAKLSYKEELEIKSIENEITEAEIKIKDLSEKLNSTELNHIELVKIAQELEDYKKTLAAKELRWLELAELKDV